VIWHIFKKDVKLLWWLAAAAAAMHFAEIALLLVLPNSPGNRQLAQLVELLGAGGILAVGFLITALVHQDSIPGVRQDWLVRPVLRRDLLLAKLFFVVLLVQTPILIADFLEPALAGFPLGPSLAAAATRSVVLLVLVDIPFLAFAAVTKNLLEAITGGVCIFFLIAVLDVLMNSGRSRGALHPTIGTGVEWITECALLLTLAIGSSFLLNLQFFRRRTVFSRFAVGALTVLCAVATMMPWQPAFAIERAMSPAPGSAVPVGVRFNPSLGRLKRDATFPAFNMREESVPLFLPMRVVGLPPDSALQADRAHVRVIEDDGRVDRVETLDLSVRRDGAADSDRNAYHTLAVPADVYDRVKNQSVRLEIDDSLTLFQLSASQAFPVVSPDHAIAGIGRCNTTINGTETAVQIRCSRAGRRPACMTAYLEHVPSGLRNPERFACDPDYSPFFAFDVTHDALARFGGNLPFRDPNGLAKYPVDGSKLKDANALVRVYQPLEHFERRLVIPDIRLSDWGAEQQ
jgi:hypothetical protein